LKIGEPGGTLDGDELQCALDDGSDAPRRLSLAAGLTVRLARPLRVPNGWWLGGVAHAKPRLVIGGDRAGGIVADGALALEHLIVQGGFPAGRPCRDRDCVAHGVVARRGRLALLGVDVRGFSGDGVRIADGGAFEARRCTFRDCGLRGVRVARAAAVLEDCVAEGNRHGIQLHLATATLRRVSGSGNCRHGIVAVHCVDGVQLLRCFASDNGRSGIVLGGSPASTPGNRDWLLDECVSVGNAQLGFAIDPTVRGDAAAIPQHGRVRRCAAIANGLHGFNVTHADEVVLEASIAIGNARDGFAVANSTRIELHNCDAFRNGERGVAFYGEADRVATSRLGGGELRLNAKALHVSSGRLAASRLGRVDR